MNKIIMSCVVGLSMLQTAQAGLNLDVNLPVTVVKKAQMPAHQNITGSQDWLAKVNQAYAQRDFRQALNEILRAQQNVHATSPDRAKMLLIKADCMRRLEMTAGAIDALDEVIAIFGGFEDAASQGFVIKAYLKKGNFAQQSRGIDQAFDAYQQVIDRAYASPERRFQIDAADAVLGKADLFNMIGRMDKALELHDQLISKFMEEEDEPLAERVAQALISKAWVLKRLGQTEHHISALDMLIQYFSDHSSPLIQLYVGQAVEFKGKWLESQQKWSEASVLYHQWLTHVQYGSSVDVDEQKGFISHLQATNLLTQAKANWSDQPVAQAQLSQALLLNQQNMTHLSKSDQLLALSDMAYIAWLTNQPEQASGYIKQIMQQSPRNAIQRIIKRNNQGSPYLGFSDFVQAHWPAIEGSTEVSTPRARSAIPTSFLKLGSERILHKK
jgi:tetratricopeptide (TPR) repeat protein